MRISVFSTWRPADFFVPEGQLRIAHRFNGGLCVNQGSSPEGTADAGMLLRHVLCNIQAAICSIAFSRPSGT